MNSSLTDGPRERPGDESEDDVALKILHTADWHLGMGFGAFGEEDERKLTRARLQVVDASRSARRYGSGCADNRVGSSSAPPGRQSPIR